MSDPTSAPRLPQGATGDAPAYFDDPDVGKLLSMLVALTGEVAVIRDRLDTVERLLDTGLPVTRDAIAHYVPDERVRGERDAWRQEYLSMVFRVLHEERARLAREPVKAYPQVVGDVEQT